MVQTTIEDYIGRTAPIPDVNRRAVVIGTVTMLLLGGAGLLLLNEAFYLLYAGIAAGAVTSFGLSLGNLSGSSQLIDSGVEGGISGAIGFVPLGIVYAGIAAMGAIAQSNEMVFLAISVVPVQLFGMLLLSTMAGFIGGVLFAICFQLVATVR